MKNKKVEFFSSKLGAFVMISSNLGVTVLFIRSFFYINNKYNDFYINNKYNDDL